MFNLGCEEISVWVALAQTDPSWKCQPNNEVLFYWGDKAHGYLNHSSQSKANPNESVLMVWIFLTKETPDHAAERIAERIYGSYVGSFMHKPMMDKVIGQPHQHSMVIGENHGRVDNIKKSWRMLKEVLQFFHCSRECNLLLAFLHWHFLWT